jgi:hypothetical protein
MGGKTGKCGDCTTEIALQSVEDFSGDHIGADYIDYQKPEVQ